MFFYFLECFVDLLSAQLASRDLAVECFECATNFEEVFKGDLHFTVIRVDKDEFSRRSTPKGHILRRNRDGFGVVP